MQIDYLIHYFPPELNGGATRAADLAKMWASTGHQIVVLTAFPNHPNGVIPQEYRGRLFLEEPVDGYVVRRTYIFATPNKGKFRRILNHLSLTCSTLVGSLLRRRPDLVIASSPPLFLGVAGYLLSRIKRVPFIFEIRDIWPQQAVDLGMLTNPRVISAMESLEMFLYRKASLVIGVTRSTKEILVQRGVPDAKIVIIPNATDLDKFCPGPPNDDTIKQFGIQDRLKNKLIVSYIGTMGLSQGLTTVLSAAQELQNVNASIHFLMVGDGAERAMLIEYASRHRLENVTFLSPQPREILPDLYRLSNIALVPLRDAPLFRSTIPSKLFEIMACGVPVILGVQGEAESIVRTAQAGICVTPESTEELIAAILELESSAEVRQLMGKNGRLHVERYYNRKILAKIYVEALSAVHTGS